MKCVWAHATSDMQHAAKAAAGALQLKSTLMAQSTLCAESHSDGQRDMQPAPQHQMLMILPSFCSRFSSRSPCLMVDCTGDRPDKTSVADNQLECDRLRLCGACLTWYKKFFLSGRLVSTTPPTLSIRQLSLPIAMNLESSLQEGREVCAQGRAFGLRSWKTTQLTVLARLPVNKGWCNTKCVCHCLQ